MGDFVRHTIILIGAAILSLTAISQDIKLMSYNIGSSDWIGNRDSVIARILANDPDVFCAIEATGSKRPFLESSLKEYNMLQTFGATPNLSESHIFLRKNMFVVVDSGFAQMETYVGYSGPGRYVNWARLKNISTDNEFIVYASHFIARVGPNADSAVIAQYRHANGMVQLMEQQASLNIPMITSGDFNADSATEVMQFLLHQTPITYYSTTITNPVELNDSWYLANPSIKKPETVSMGLAAIDWILGTTNTNVLEAIIDTLGENPQGELPSDHLPLITIFNLSSPTSVNAVGIGTGLKVHPNPFQDQIYFEIPNTITGEIFIQICDLTGRIIRNLEYSATSHPIRIELNDIPDGLYFCSLRTSDQIITGSILKHIGN